MESERPSWVEHLMKTLARSAARKYPATPVPAATIAEFIQTETSVLDWDNEFVEEVYSRYLEKINEAGEKLEEKVNSESESSSPTS